MDPYVDMTYKNNKKVSYRDIVLTGFVVITFIGVVFAGQFVSGLLDKLKGKNSSLYETTSTLKTEIIGYQDKIKLLEEENKKLKNELKQITSLQSNPIKTIDLTLKWEDDKYLIDIQKAYLSDEVSDLDTKVNTLIQSDYLILKVTINDKRVSGLKEEVVLDSLLEISGKPLFISTLELLPQEKGNMYITFLVDSGKSTFDLDIVNGSDRTSSTLNFSTQNVNMMYGDFSVKKGIIK